MRKTALSKLAKGRNAKRVAFRSRNARARQDLGGGFLREVYPQVTVSPQQFVRISMTSAPGRVVINGGWSITGATPNYATDFYPATDNTWVIWIHNPTNASRTITPYLISKTVQ